MPLDGTLSNADVTLPAGITAEVVMKSKGDTLARLYAQDVARGKAMFGDAAAQITAEMLRYRKGLPGAMADPDDEVRASAEGIAEWTEKRLEAAVEAFNTGGFRALRKPLGPFSAAALPAAPEEQATMPDGIAAPQPAPPPPAPDPRRQLTEALAVEGVRLGKDAREAVGIAKASVAGMDDAAVRDHLASLADRKWALREDGTLAPDPAPGAAGGEPVRALLAGMRREAADFRDKHPDLAQVVDILAERAAQAGALAHAGLRTRIAYAAQDVEKAVGKPLPMPEPLRAEMATLAATAPGLENGRMKALLAETANIADAGLVAAIRRTAADLAKAGEGQHGEDAAERVEALERRLRVQGPVPGALRPAVEVASPGPGPQAPPPEAAPPAAPPPQQAPPQPRPAPTRQAAPTAAATQPVDGRPASVAAGLMAAMRQPPPAGMPPWQTVTPGLGERVTTFEAKMRDGRTARLMADAAKAGNAAMLAVERFAEGPGRALLGKVEAAATAAGGGSATAVVAGMAPGAEHATLRAEFDAAMASDPRFAQAHREVRAALEAYGRARIAAGEDVQARRLPAERLGSLERLDAALGEQAARIPGEKAGGSVLDEIGQKAAEVLREAAETVAAALASAAAGAKARFSAGPSPAP